MRRGAAILLFTTATGTAGVIAVACGSADESASSGTSSGGPGDAGKNDGGGTFPAADAAPVPIAANAIVLVHAAMFPPFRICFDGADREQPIPNVDLMPSSNLPGIDVGAAVRLASRNGKLGRAFVYSETKIRGLYFNDPDNGPSCHDLLASGLGSDAIQVADDLPDLSTGVHLLALTGCANESFDPTATVDRCGPDWTGAKGNLALRHVPLTAFGRLGNERLPVQIIQLSHDLDVVAKMREIGVAFGSLDAAAPSPFLEGQVPFGKAIPNPPIVLDTATIDLAEFASTGLFVTAGAFLDGGFEGGADAGDAGDAAPDAVAVPREILASESLAEIQRRSSPRSLPPDWFATASSYVVLTVGEIDPKTPDGGPGDERRALHMLAIPLATVDAGIPDAANPDAKFDARSDAN